MKKFLTADLALLLSAACAAPSLAAEDDPVITDVPGLVSLLTADPIRLILDVKDARTEKAADASKAQMITVETDPALAEMLLTEEQPAGAGDAAEEASAPIVSVLFADIEIVDAVTLDGGDYRNGNSTAAMGRPVAITGMNSDSVFGSVGEGSGFVNAEGGTRTYYSNYRIPVTSTSKITTDDHVSTDKSSVRLALGASGSFVVDTEEGYTAALSVNDAPVAYLADGAKVSLKNVTDAMDIDLVGIPTVSGSLTDWDAAETDTVFEEKPVFSLPMGDTYRYDFFTDAALVEKETEAADLQVRIDRISDGAEFPDVSYGLEFRYPADLLPSFDFDFAFSAPAAEPAPETDFPISIVRMQYHF